MKSIDKIKHVLTTLSGSNDYSILDRLDLTTPERELINNIIADDLVEEALELLNATNTSADFLKLKSDLNIQDKTPKLWQSYVKYAAILVVALTVSFFGLKPLLFKSETLNIKSEAITLELEDGSIKEIHLNETLQVTDSTGTLVASQNSDHITYLNHEDNKLSYNTLNVPHGKTFQLVLSDGTQVHLNSGTSIKFPVHFINKGNREVFLNGEAYFDVSKDKLHPFIVNTSTSTVEVLGTEFNIMNYDNETNTNVVLVEGSVEFTATQSNKAVKLTPGMMASVNKNEPNADIALSKVNPLMHTAWINGRLIYRDLAFNEVIKKLERKYNVSIENNNSELGKQTFSGNLGNETIYEVLTYFKEIYGIKYEIKDNTIYIN
ncbi:FecR family protein [Formosa sp. S-31]|uniref:FecR family protein n=1 Tax=Formosa sp. S-31 TaxID=2790949 RepID=UPI003EB73635